MLHLRFCLMACVGAAALSGVGCVPYQTYQMTKMALEQAKDANADLVKKYNEAIQRLAAGGGDDSQYQARLAQLEAENARLLGELQNLPPTGFSQAEIDRVGGFGGGEEDGGFQLGEALLFSAGSDELKGSAKRVLDSIAEILQGNYADEMVTVEGHTDNTPIRVSQHKSNMNLGARRALAVFDYFVSRGIPEHRLITLSYSFNKPIDPVTKDTVDGRRKNRRVVVRRGGMRI